MFAAYTFCASVLLAVPVPDRRTETDATSWVGKTVLVVANGLFITGLDERNQSVPPQTPLSGLDYRVYAEREAHIQLKTREGISGWLPKSNAVLVEDAVALFTGRLARDGANIDTYNRRGWAWKLKGEYEAALKDMTAAIQLSPQAALYNNRALIHVAKKDYDGAIRDYSSAIELDPRYALPHANRALMWHAKKDYDKAIADFDRALTLNPSYAFAFRNRAVTWHAKKEYDKAIADCTEALRIDPKLASAHADRGNAWSAKGDNARARTDLDQAIRLDPRVESAYLYRGRLLDKQKDADQALADYAEALRLKPRYVPALLSRAATWIRIGAYPKASADFERALRLEPKNADACADAAFFLATCNETKLRDGKRALDLARQAVELDKASAAAWEALAAAQAETGDFAAAVRSQQIALELIDRSTADLARARLELYRKHQPYRR